MVSSCFHLNLYLIYALSSTFVIVGLSFPQIYQVNLQGQPVRFALGTYNSSDSMKWDVGTKDSTSVERYNDLHFDIFRHLLMHCVSLAYFCFISLFCMGSLSDITF